jgi:hypothetical protein
VRWCNDGKERQRHELDARAKEGERELGGEGKRCGGGAHLL